MYHYETIHPLPRGLTINQRFVCVKAHKRLWVQDVVSGYLIYTHPDFLRPVDRKLMTELARRASLRGHLDICDIMVFEAKTPRGAGYRKRPPEHEPEWEPLP
jgi:hypothetical protein